jgi:hypothetical protein
MTTASASLLTEPPGAGKPRLVERGVPSIRDEVRTPVATSAGRRPERVAEPEQRGSDHFLVGGIEKEVPLADPRATRPQHPISGRRRRQLGVGALDDALQAQVADPSSAGLDVVDQRADRRRHPVRRTRAEEGGQLSWRPAGVPRAGTAGSAGT